MDKVLVTGNICPTLFMFLKRLFLQVLPKRIQWHNANISTFVKMWQDCVDPAGMGQGGLIIGWRLAQRAAWIPLCRNRLLHPTTTITIYVLACAWLQRGDHRYRYDFHRMALGHPGLPAAAA
jgi:hypothetical protein